MMSSADYAVARAAVTRFKSALTRAQNKKDWHAVIKVAADFEQFFDAKGWPQPDDWSRWQRAADDARHALQRASNHW